MDSNELLDLWTKNNGWHSKEHTLKIQTYALIEILARLERWNK